MYKFFILATPVPPVIRNVEMLSKSAVVSWERGYDGGSRQTLEIWYRISNSNDYHWKTIKNIPADVTTYVVYDVEPRQSYLFSMRGVNKMGFGVFSRIFRSDKSTSSIYDENDHVKGKSYMFLTGKWSKHLRVIQIYELYFLHFTTMQDALSDCSNELVWTSNVDQ